MEKTYWFTVSKGKDNQVSVEVKEFDLTDFQKDLLLGEITKLYLHLPTEIKEDFKTNFYLTNKPKVDDDDLPF